jgi:methionine-rich copper-binding protein CopC
VKLVAIRCLVLLALATALPAHAHDIIVRSHPAKDTSVRPGPLTVEIAYSGRIDLSRSRLALVDPAGGERDLTLDKGVASNVLKADAGTLAAGSYVLRWFVLSADAHLTRGTIPFRVTER